MLASIQTVSRTFSGFYARTTRTRETRSFSSASMTPQGMTWCLSCCDTRTITTLCTTAVSDDNTHKGTQTYTHRRRQSRPCVHSDSPCSALYLSVDQVSSVQRTHRGVCVCVCVCVFVCVCVCVSTVKVLTFLTMPIQPTSARPSSQLANLQHIKVGTQTHTEQCGTHLQQHLNSVKSD